MRWRRRSTHDFSDEIRAHIAHETDRLIAEGLSPEDAARAARRAFGNVTSATERFHDSRRIGWLDHLRQDLHTAVRSILRYPVVAIVAVLSLGAGIGATAASLTIRDILFENPPPLYAQPEQLSQVQVNRRDRPIRPLGSAVRGDLFATWHREHGDAMAASAATSGLTDVRTAERAEPARVRSVTANLFSVLGVAPELGRSFSRSTNDQFDAMEAVLSYRIWQDWFSGRSDVLGATIWINDRPHTIVGVMPSRFWFSELNDPIWTRLDPNGLTANTPVQVVVRRPASTSEAALATRLEGSMTTFAQMLPAGEGPLHLRVSAIKGSPLALGMAAILPFILGASVLLTLLIACANVAILMTAQWTRREAETAVRSAIGASRWRLMRALLAESLLLAVCAGTLGILVTVALQTFMLRNAPLASTFFDLSLDVGVLAKAGLVTLAAGVCAGLGPAVFETRRLQLDPLRGIATSDRVRQRWSHTLVVLEITLTLALLVVTSSMINGYRRAKDADLGFDPAPLLISSVENQAGVQIAPLMDALGRVPGVRSVAAATAMPLGGVGRRISTSTTATGTDPVGTEQFSIDTSFFDVLGVPLHAGRGFTTQDTVRTRTAIVNESLAAQLFGPVPPIGRQVWIGDTAYDVIGVVRDYKGNPIERRINMPMIFLPLSTDPKDVTTLRFLIRADRDPAPLVQPVRRTLSNAAVGLRFTGGYSMEQIRTVQTQEMLAGTAPLFPLIVIGVLLTSSGIYGVLAFAVSRRARELAVRVAIGADRTRQAKLMLARSLRLVTLGSIFGVALTFGLSRLVRAAGAAGTIYDPPLAAFVLPVLLVFVVGIFATWIPTRRALSVDPAIVLKSN